MQHASSFIYINQAMFLSKKKKKKSSHVIQEVTSNFYSEAKDQKLLLHNAVCDQDWQDSWQP